MLIVANQFVKQLSRPVRAALFGNVGCLAAFRVGHRERQLAAGQPAGVFAVAQELEQLGLSQHDIRHEIGGAVAGQLWYMEKEGCVFDEGRYLVDLQEIVEAHRQDGAGN